MCVCDIDSSSEELKCTRIKAKQEKKNQSLSLRKNSSCSCRMDDQENCPQKITFSKTKNYLYKYIHTTTVILKRFLGVHGLQMF